jgi:MoxR-like ATPase
LTGRGGVTAGEVDSSDGVAAATGVAARFLDNIETVVHGKRGQIELVISALMCGGHALLEDVPGTAKTVLARAISGSIRGAHSTRIQCTPDLQPTDVTGLSIFNPKERDFEFRPGPVFANVVLVDEINRAMPKTQSALLEAMAEQQVTVDGETRRLGEPFLVMATQNPIEYEGTFPLPEAQLDRFFVKTTLGYPDADDEARIVDEQLAGHPLARLAPVVGLDDIATLRAAVATVFVHEAVARWIVELVRATRRLELVAIGSSVRGTLALNRAARAWAVIRGRRYVTPEDVEQLFVPVLMHRLLFRPSFLVELRDRGWDAAGLEVRARCLELAPKPGFDIDLDVPAAASGR